jgi:hypothetical protein
MHGLMPIASVGGDAFPNNFQLKKLDNKHYEIKYSKPS